MKSTPKTLSLLVLLAAFAAVVMFAMNGSGEGELAPLPTIAAVEGELDELVDQESTSGAVLTGGDRVSAAPHDPVRVIVEDSGAEFAQGVHGVVTDPAGRPVPDTRVYLVEGLSPAVWMQPGMITPPVAKTMTAEDGSFALGLDRAEPRKQYGVRIVTDAFVDHGIPNVTVTEGQWWDAGTIRLEVGAVVTGRVTIAGNPGLPVPGARVMLTQQTLAAWQPVPEREEGLIAEVDHTGAFRIENAPAGQVTVAAVAKGYARVTNSAVTVDERGETRVMLELPLGASIGGVVLDPSGAVIADARIEAMAMSNKTPSGGAARSGKDGGFEVIGLRDGPYLLRVSAAGHVEARVQPIRSGDRDLELVLERQAAARLRVLGVRGQPMRRYDLTLKSYHEGQAHFGNTRMPRRTAKPDASGVFTYQGIDPGSYVFQVEASGLAKAFSAPFTVGGTVETPLVEVQLDEGGAIEGLVVDQRGRALPGVVVETLPDHLDENPLMDLFGALVPYKVTKSRVTTDAQGRYRLDLLTPGSYQLKFSHRDYSVHNLKGNAVVAGAPTQVPRVRLERGTLVGGDVRVDGVPAAQVKVVLTGLGDAEEPQLSRFSCQAVTGNGGQFVLPKRVPPGRYEVTAGRQTLGNIFIQLADFQKTKREITLGRGQEEYSLQIAIAGE